jgi:uncharacterized membrane protein
MASMTRDTSAWPKREVSRVEGFSDAVFAFAITLLVVSLEVPKTFDELVRLLREAPAFAACFALFWLIWKQHHQFFRRYGLEDPKTLRLNTLLLFVVLLYVYPLKFLFTMVLGQFIGGPLDSAKPPIEIGQVRPLMVIYSTGYAAVWAIFALMYRHAYACRDTLGLDARQRFDTLAQAGSMLMHVAIGGISTVMALVSPPRLAGLNAGLTYFLIGPAQSVYWWRVGKRRRAIFAGTQASEETQRSVLG